MSSRCVKFRPDSAKGRSRELRKAEAIHHRSRSREGVPAKLESLGLWSATGVWKRASLRSVDQQRERLRIAAVCMGGAASCRRADWIMQFQRKSLNLVVTWLSGEGG